MGPPALPKGHSGVPEAGACPHAGKWPPLPPPGSAAAPQGTHGKDRDRFPERDVGDGRGPGLHPPGRLGLDLRLSGPLECGVPGIPRHQARGPFLSSRAGGPGDPLPVRVRGEGSGPWPLFAYRPWKPIPLRPLPEADQGLEDHPQLRLPRAAPGRRGGGEVLPYFEGAGHLRKGVRDLGGGKAGGVGVRYALQRTFAHGEERIRKPCGEEAGLLRVESSVSHDRRYGLSQISVQEIGCGR